MQDKFALEDIANYSTTSVWGGSCPDSISLAFNGECKFVNTKDVHSSETPGIIIYPNPNYGNDVYIDLPTDNYSKVDNIRVYSAEGKLLLDEKILETEHASSRRLKLDVSDFNSSMLFISLIGDEIRYHGKVVILN